jgi:hypothetical protein
MGKAPHHDRKCVAFQEIASFSTTLATLSLTGVLVESRERTAPKCRLARIARDMAEMLTALPLAPCLAIDEWPNAAVGALMAHGATASRD